MVITGTLEKAHRSGESSSDQVIARFIADEMFGEFEFFEEDTRTAFASAAEDSTLLCFPRTDVDLEHLFDEYAHIFVKIYHTLISVNAGRQRLTHKLIS